MKPENFFDHVVTHIQPDKTYGRFIVDHYSRQEAPLMRLGYYRKYRRFDIDIGFRFGDKQIEKKEHFFENILQKGIVGISILGLFGGVLVADHWAAKAQGGSNPTPTPTPALTMTANTLGQ